MPRSEQPAGRTKRETARRQVERMLRLGDLDGAAAGYGQLIADDPEDWASVNALGDVLRQRGDGDSAIEHLRRDDCREEGFITKPAAICRTILKVQQIWRYRHVQERNARLSAGRHEEPPA